MGIHADKIIYDSHSGSRFQLQNVRILSILFIKVAFYLMNPKLSEENRFSH